MNWWQHWICVTFMELWFGVFFVVFFLNVMYDKDHFWDGSTYFYMVQIDIKEWRQVFFSEKNRTRWIISSTSMEMLEMCAQLVSNIHKILALSLDSLLSEGSLVISVIILILCISFYKCYAQSQLHMDMIQIMQTSGMKNTLNVVHSAANTH